MENVRTSDSYIFFHRRQRFPGSPPAPNPNGHQQLPTEWETSSYSQFVVEYCKLGTSEWIPSNENHPVNAQSFTVEGPTPRHAQFPDNGDQE
ncbi:hypothetical protein NQ317_012961 [Molorchus minor]|uniref:Uncharacterized protein n=1 Tax=Molorchus minor TaxID=1323400 RepID=A0ABQ9IX78_9CUCU|nr:hypothetical protein NQ317_012961 [Molorchus minor]